MRAHENQRGTFLLGLRRPQRAVNRFGQRAQLRRRVLNAVDPRVGVQVEEPRHVLADAVGEVRRIGVGLGRAPPGASSSPFLS